MSDTQVSSTDTPSMEEAKKKHLHYAWWISIAGFLSQLILIIGVQGPGIALNAISADLGISTADAGIIPSMFGFGGLVAATIWGIVVDKTGLRKTFTISAVASAVGVILIGLFGHSLASTAALFFLLGLLTAGMSNATFPKLIATWFAPSMRGKGIVPASLGATVAGVLVGIILPRLLMTHSWQMSFIFLGIAAIIIAIVISLLVRDEPADLGLTPCGSPAGTPVVSQKDAVRPKEKGRIGEVLKMPITWKFGIIGILYGLFVAGQMSYLVSGMMSVGLDIAAAGLCISIVTLTMCIGQIVFPILSDKIARKFIMAIMAFGAAAATIILFMTMGSGNLALIYTVVVFVGIFFGASPVMQNQMAEVYPLNVRGTGPGVLATFFSIGTTIGPLVCAWAIKVTGMPTGFYYATIIAMVLVGILCIAFLPKTGGKYGDPFAKEAGPAPEGTPKAE